MMTRDEIVRQLEARADPAAVAGMARYGITGAQVYGVKVPVLRQMARDIGRSHALALDLWAHNSRETRVLASMIDEWRAVDEAQMEAWVADFDSWEVCDQVCGNLFAKTPYAFDRALAWSERSEVFVKRAGFVLMANLAHRSSNLPDERLAAFLPIIEREAGDGRNFVKKAANWALRDIGKRNQALNTEVIVVAARLKERPEPSARWNGNDAWRELTSATVQKRLAGHGGLKTPAAARQQAPETPPPGESETPA
jgi:3-methyladenine DNA glycosylase AlkD